MVLGFASVRVTLSITHFKGKAFFLIIENHPYFYYKKYDVFAACDQISREER
jgi:hypothetical protein